MKKYSDFRAWVHRLWIENCEEHFAHAEPVLGVNEYFQKYKFWLKREYQHQQRKQQRMILEKQAVDQKIANSYNHKHSIINLSDT
jgi:hypothetical protein